MVQVVNWQDEYQSVWTADQLDDYRRRHEESSNVLLLYIFSVLLAARPVSLLKKPIEGRGIDLRSPT